MGRPLAPCHLHYLPGGPKLQPEPEFVKLFRESTGIDSQPGGPVRQSYLTYRPARLLRHAESIPGQIKGLQMRALVLFQTAEGLILTVAINYTVVAWPCLLCYTNVSTPFLRFNLRRPSSICPQLPATHTHTICTHAQLLSWIAVFSNYMHLL
jgi:hypothetical protein